MKLVCLKNIYYIKTKDQLLSLHTHKKYLAERIYCNVVKHCLLDKLNNANNAQKEEVGKAAPKKEVVPIAIEQKFDEYIQTCVMKGLSKSKIRIKKRIKSLLDESQIKNFDDFTQRNLNILIENMDYMSDTSKQTYLAQLRAFLNYCVKHSAMSKKRLSRLDFPKYKTAARDVVFTDDDLYKLFGMSKSDQDFHIYLLTLYNTLCRPNEVASMRTDDIDYENRKITVYMSKVCRYKTVYITRDFADLLNHYICENDIHGYIFHGADNPEYYAKKFKRLRNKLGLNRRYTLYVMRHTSITNLLNKCNDVEFVARQAGNDPKTTMKHYVNRRDSYYIELLDKIGLF